MRFHIINQQVIIVYPSDRRILYRLDNVMCIDGSIRIAQVDQ